MITQRLADLPGELEAMEQQRVQFARETNEIHAARRQALALNTLGDLDGFDVRQLPSALPAAGSPAIPGGRSTAVDAIAKARQQRCLQRPENTWDEVRQVCNEAPIVIQHPGYAYLAGGIGAPEQAGTDSGQNKGDGSDSRPSGDGVSSPGEELADPARESVVSIQESLAFCRNQSGRDDGWICDGPGQQLLTAWTLDTALDLAGCGHAQDRRRQGFGQGYIYFCEIALEGVDLSRDIASLYAPPSAILDQRATFECPERYANSANSCSRPGLPGARRYPPAVRVSGGS